MTIQERIQQMLGRFVMENALLEQRVAELEARVRELDAKPETTPTPVADGIPSADRL